MNPEAHKIVQEMEKHTPEPGAVSPTNPKAVQNFLSIRMSRLFVILAEDTEKSSEELTKQTGNLVEVAKAQKQLAENLSTQTDRLVGETVILRRFTKGVFWLTVVLSIFTAVLIIIAYLEYSTKAHESVKSGIKQQSTQNNQTP
jgi:hypothetical protein